jgi:putative flippase GtrA
VHPVDTFRRLGGAGRTLVKEFGAFGVVGAVCFVLDVGLFQVLYDLAGLGAVTSKAIATAVSMTVAYVGHRYWSFSHRARPGVRREYVRFVLINVGTLAIGLAAVAFVRHGLQQESTLVLQAANVASIAVGTLIRFLAYKRWVFPAHEQPLVTPISAEAVLSSATTPGATSADVPVHAAP